MKTTTILRKIQILTLLMPFVFQSIFAQSSATNKGILTTDFITTWKTDNPGTSNSTSITIPTYPGETYNYDIDWDNDGVYDETGVTGDITHDYGTAGTYTISIRGEFPRIYFNNEGDKDKLLSVDQWGNIAWTSMEKAFYGCSNLEITISASPDLTNVTDLSYMFANCTIFNAGVGDWDVSNITNMSHMLENCTAFNKYLGDWDMGSVTDISYLLAGCSSFNGFIGNWNLVNVTDMNHLFYACPFNKYIGDWETTNVTNMSHMFEASGFKKYIGNWDTSSVTDMSYMFKDSDYSKYVGDWDTANVTDMSHMFENCSEYNKYSGNWDTSNVTNMSYMFSNCSIYDQDLKNWNISSLTDASHMFDGVTLSIANYDSLLVNWQEQPHNNNVVLDAGNSQYCHGAEAREILTGTDGWTITDGGSAGTPPEVDSLPDVITCSDYTLPELTNGDYFTEPGGNGTQLNAGDVISESQIIYIYVTNETCDNQSSFLVTINPTLDNTVTVNTDPVELIANQADATYQWVDCDNNNEPIEGETNQNFIPQQSGNYAVIININDCSVTSDCYEVTVTASIDDLLMKNQVKVYPNPSSEFLTIQNNLGSIRFQIIDLQGMIVMESILNEYKNNVNIKSLNSGIYIISITALSDNFEGKSSFYKFIKK